MSSIPHGNGAVSNDSSRARRRADTGYRRTKAKARKGFRFRPDFQYAHRFFEAIDTPKSLACSLLLKYGEIGQLVRLESRSIDYVDPVRFYQDHQSVSLLAKYPFRESDTPGYDSPKVAAVKKFIQSENQCLETNARFRDAWLRGFPPREMRVLSNASRKIANILGSVPKLEDLDFRFGPGAAYGVRGHTSPYNKVSADLECTFAMTHILGEFLAEFPGWITPDSVVDMTLRDGSELTFVAKNAKTERPICIEPLLNGLMQKGIGSYMRDRLKRYGIDLDDQTINQKLAGMAIGRRLSTVDFASASDTVAYNLVLDLFPPDWVEFLDLARCGCYTYEGVTRTFQKFSSMGNAYTFELETLIFYTLAQACCEEVDVHYETGVSLSVYGDDVIIPRDAYDCFQAVSSYCGFTISDTKSFKDGRFFESCGHDYFDGILVRPFFLKKRLNKLLPAFYATNTVRRFEVRLRLACQYAPKRGWFPARTPDIDKLHNLYDWCVDGIPKRYRLLGPEGFGDGHLVSEFDESRPSRHRQDRRDRVKSRLAPQGESDIAEVLLVESPGPYDGWSFRSYAEVSIRIKTDWNTPYALYSALAIRPSGLPSQDFWAQRGWEDTEMPSPLDNSEGYTVRNKTKLVLQELLCPGEWLGPYTSHGIFHSQAA